MEKLTDWFQLWRELVEIKNEASSRSKTCREKSYWKRKARQFKDKTGNPQVETGSSRKFIASTLESNPGSTLLDIGAGIGDWCALLSPFAREITALEPSAAMGELFLETINAGNIDNVNLIQGNWPGIDIQPHDYSLASHSMYGETDLKSFIEKMVSVSRKGCFLVSRVLFSDTIMEKAAQRVLGQPYDSPCFQVIYNALLQLGLHPNVLMETGKTWKAWSNESLDEALKETKNRLGIWNSDEHDDYLMSLLEEGLSEENGKLVWPVGNGSALMYWNCSSRGGSTAYPP